MDVTSEDASAMLRTWGEVVQAGYELWATLLRARRRQRVYCCTSVLYISAPEGLPLLAVSQSCMSSLWSQLGGGCSQGSLHSVGRP